MSGLTEHPAPSDNTTDSAIRLLGDSHADAPEPGIPANLVLVAVPLCVLLFSVLSLVAVLIRRREPQRRSKEH